MIDNPGFPGRGGIEYYTPFFKKKREISCKYHGNRAFQGILPIQKGRANQGR